MSLLYTDDLSNNVGLLLRTWVTFIPHKTPLDQILKLAIIQKINEFLSSQGYLLYQFTQILGGQLLLVRLPLSSFGNFLIYLAWLVIFWLHLLSPVLMVKQFPLTSLLHHFASFLALLAFAIKLVYFLELINFVHSWLFDFADLITDFVLDFLVRKYSLIIMTWSLFASLVHNLDFKYYLNQWKDL